MKTTRHTVMAGLIRQHGWKRGAELGVWQGSLFGYLLRSFPDLKLLGVDHWEAVGPYAGKDMQAARAMVQEVLAAYRERALFIQADTITAATWVIEASLDFVFIDASHDTASVLADIHAWRPKVRAGGALTGHDANLDSVQAALNRSLPGWQLLEANVWIFPCA